MSGGARLEPEVGRFFLGLGLALLQGYGQTEAGPVISANPPGATGSTPSAARWTGWNVRIAEDGEILVRGDLVMQGYWGRPDETASGRSATAGCTPATSASWTTTDTCGSPTARRT